MMDMRDAGSDNRAMPQGGDGRRVGKARDLSKIVCDFREFPRQDRGSFVALRGLQVLDCSHEEVVLILKYVLAAKKNVRRHG
jgi:hypothetical protein